MLVYQTFHLTDHLLQYLQREYFDMGEGPGLFQGILHSPDVVVHLWLNLIEFIPIVVLWIMFRELQVRKSINNQQSFLLKCNLNSFHLRLLNGSILFLLIFQVLHLLDHILQYFQMVYFNMSIAPGLFQGLLNMSDAVVHVWINGLLLLGIVSCWYSTRIGQIKNTIITNL